VLLALAVTWYASRQDGRRLVVLVADTVNATGDRDLDAISGLLLASLEQSHRLSILSRSRVLELAREHGRDLAGAIDETVGREIGRSGGARALLLLAVHRLGSLYALELRGLDPARDAYLFTLREEAPTKEAIIPALERIAERVRRELHEPARDVEARTFPVASVTASLEAYRHYFQGRNQAAQLAFPEAVASLQKALAADPDFALAHLALSQMVGVGQLTDAVRAGHREAALRLQARLPPRERSLLVAATAEEEGRPAEAEQLYRVLAEELPDDAEVRLLLGELLLDQERPAEAAPFLSRALELSPADEVAGAYLFRALGFLGRGDEILAAARRGRAASPGAATTLLLAEALLWSGDVEAAVGAAREALALGDAQAPRTLAVAALRAGDDAALAEAKLTDGFNRAAVELFKGRPLAARAALDGSPTRTGGWAALITRERVVLRAAVGPPEALRQEVERLAAHDGHVVGPAAAMVAWAGEAAGAARLAGKMERGSLDLALYRAVADWRGGRRDEAVVALQALAATHASGSSFVDGFLLAEACLEAGRADLARPALLRHEQRNVSLTWLAVTYPATLLMLATAEEALGRPEDARRTAARLERLWRDAEPGYPGLLRLRALEARLGR
jgi:tetratricopeptide (TPR) repeat protein